MSRMTEYLLVALGSALGGAGRYWLSGLIAQSFGKTFPWGTLLVNVSGSFAIGVVAALSAPEGRFLLNPRFTLFFTYGLCGGYTTFSSFSLQTLDLAREGQWLYAGANVVSSLVFCLVSVWLGYVAGQTLSR